MADNNDQGNDEAATSGPLVAVRPDSHPTGAGGGQAGGPNAARWQRHIWSRRARTWDQHASPALASVTSAVLGVAAARPGYAVLDLGCGTGQISIPLASRGARVLAVDVSPAMAAQLGIEAERRGLSALTVTTRGKVRTLARRGPGGWWRIAKNAVRYLLRLQERPISMAAWTGLLQAAGFTAVAASSIAAEAGLVTGRRPEARA